LTGLCHISAYRAAATNGIASLAEKFAALLAPYPRPIYPEKLMRRKLNFGFVILVLGLQAHFGFSARRSCFGSMRGLFGKTTALSLPGFSGWPLGGATGLSRDSNAPSLWTD